DFMSGDARDSRRAVCVLIGLVPGQLGGRDACGKHSYEHISSPNLRRGCILEKQLFRSAPARGAAGSHKISPRLLRCGGVLASNGTGASIRVVWDWENLASCLVSILGHDLFSLSSIFDGFDADQVSAFFFEAATVDERDK